MNDRFKFRVWAKPNKPTKTEGYYVDDADYMVMTPDGKVQIEYYCDNGYDGYIDSFKQDEVVVEQCTGLKDKNGKLIYEGDIVKSGKHVYPVEWYVNGFAVNDGYDYLIDNEEWEVIGNIHENADLLEVENDNR